MHSKDRLGNEQGLPMRAFILVTMLYAATPPAPTQAQLLGIQVQQMLELATGIGLAEGCGLRSRMWAGDVRYRLWDKLAAISGNLWPDYETNPAHAAERMKALNDSVDRLDQAEANGKASVGAMCGSPQLSAILTIDDGIAAEAH
jgi:hypothetical protein